MGNETTINSLIVGDFFNDLQKKDPQARIVSVSFVLNEKSENGLKVTIEPILTIHKTQ